MRTLSNRAVLLAVAVVAAMAGCQPMKPSSIADLPQRTREQLAAEPAESDAAVILRQALTESAGLPADQQGAAMESAMKQADEARKFRITEESPLPQGWPPPSLPGLIRIKSYPPSRFAWVRAPENRNGQFMTLSRTSRARTSL